jgi:hypothetical protein
MAALEYMDTQAGHTLSAGATCGRRIARFHLVAAERSGNTRESFSRIESTASGAIAFGSLSQTRDAFSTAATFYTGSAHHAGVAVVKQIPGTSSAAFGLARTTTSVPIAFTGTRIYG